MKNNKIMVSVMMLAYQHEKYIAQAIESVLMQKTNFRYELVIGEDCSKDRTREIVIKYKKKYPNIIQLLLQKKNVGVLKNSDAVKRHCRGKYIAILEGDDYWTDDKKLQKQVDFLENNHTYSACFQDASIITDKGKSDMIFHFLKSDINSYYDYFQLEDPMIPNATLMFRNIFKLGNYYHYFLHTKYIGDRILYMLILKHGKIKYLHENEAIYRFITNGKTSFSSQGYEERSIDTIKAFRVQLKIVPKDIKSFVYRDILNRQLELYRFYIYRNDYKKLIIYILFHTKFIEKINLLKLNSKI